MAGLSHLVSTTPGSMTRKAASNSSTRGISTCWIPATGRLPQAAESSPSNTAGIEMRRSSGAARIFGATGVDFRFNLRRRGIQQGFSGSFETLLSISVSIETEMRTAFDEGRGVVGNVAPFREARRTFTSYVRFQWVGPLPSRR